MISFVHDGDTIYAKNVREGIRLIGIDAPEMAGSYRCGKDAKCTETAEECGASEAKEKLKELVLNREVVLTEDTMVGVTDKYGRLLRYIYYCRGGPPWPPQEGQTQGFVPTGKCQDLSLVLIQSGLAREAGFGNSYTHQKQYRQAETEAKEKKLGIWGKCP
jgi:endonuclease YncB( thermonuclease family)